MEETRREQPELKIDNVLSSQPELGPHIPDGGYGWIIFAIAIIFKLFIPSLIVSYGIITLYWHIETEIEDLPILWETSHLYTPLIYMAALSIFEPCSTALIQDNRWPKLVSYSGVCLICAGFLILWFVIQKGMTIAFLYIFSGLLTGLGSSIVTVMSDTLISQYFKLKLIAVTGVLRIISFLGYVLTPILLGHAFSQFGILKGLIWYQVILLQGSIFSMAFKKPKYLKANQNTKNYKLIHVAADDEEDIFSKPATELSCIPTSGTEVAVEANIEASTSQEPKTHTVDIHEVRETTSNNWETFAEEGTSRKDSLTRQHLHFSFDNKELERIDRFEDDFVHIPKPLYNDVQINNNTSYSFEAFDSLPSQKSEETIFARPVVKRGCIRRFFQFLESPKFYMLLLQNLPARFTMFTFFTLFPTYFYTNVSDHVYEVSQILGQIAVVGLLHSIITVALHSAHTKKREFILAVSSLIASFSFIVIALIQYELWLLVGAAGIYLSISTFEHMGEPLLKLQLRGESNQMYLGLYIVTGLSFAIFAMMNITFRFVFVFMGVLQLLSCISWGINILLRHGTY